MTPKTPPLRDRAYLTWLREQPCVLTGERSSERESVDPAHIGTLGKGIKSPDNEALPLIHRLHAEGHQSGEMAMFRRHAPTWLLREALRAYARQMYREWKDGQR